MATIEESSDCEKKTSATRPYRLAWTPFHRVAIVAAGKKSVVKKIVMCLSFGILRQGVKRPVKRRVGSTVMIGRASQELNGGMAI